MSCDNSFVLDHSALSVSDVARATAIGHTPHVIAEAYTVGLRTTLEFYNWCIHPALMAQEQPSAKLSALHLLFGRIRFLSETLLSLTNVKHFQSIVGASRTAIELYVDMNLLAEDRIKNGVEKFFAFNRVQRLKSARRIVEFHTKHPGLRGNNLSVYDSFIASHGAAIDTERARLWGAKASPQHWTNINFYERPEGLAVEIKQLVSDGYDYRNWLLHSGAAGVHEFSDESLTALAATGVRVVHDVFIGAIDLMATQLGIRDSINDFPGRLNELRTVPGFVMVDLRLRAQGEPAAGFTG
jgi:hypothetical protein